MSTLISKHITFPDINVILTLEKEEIFHTITMKILDQNTHVIPRGNFQKRPARSYFTFISSSIPEISNKVVYLRGTGKDYDFNQYKYPIRSEVEAKFIFERLAESFLLLGEELSDQSYAYF